MKGRRGKTSDFQVPRSVEMHGIITEARELTRDGFLFPGMKRAVVSDITEIALMERRGLNERPHGFWSPFRHWIAETTAPHDVAQT